MLLSLPISAAVLPERTESVAISLLESQLDDLIAEKTVDQLESSSLSSQSAEPRTSSQLVTPDLNFSAITLPTVVPTAQLTEANSVVISQLAPTLPQFRSTDLDRLNQSLPPLPAQPLPPLPSPNELLPQPVIPPTDVPEEIPAQIFVKQFQVQGSTVFSSAQLAAVTAPFQGRNLSFAELLQVRSAITQLYVSRGYVTSGAYLPPQTLKDGVVVIQVVEGSLEGINVIGTRRLRPSYIRSRLELASSIPLNTNRLLEALRLLQLDPLIRNISADLQAGSRPGTSLLQVQVAEANTFHTDLMLNNGRSASVGSFRRGIQLSQVNLLGFGDGITVRYNNTDGSNQIDMSYTIPLNPRNGTLKLTFGASSSNVIEPSFVSLNIVSESRHYEITLRQPIYQTPTEEVALGLTASRQESKAEFSPFNTETLPFQPLGADANGRTRISALRLFQEWTQRSSSYVLAARSQFSIGLDWFNSTINAGGADSRFFAWRGQGQWVRLLAPETLLLTRLDVQASDRPLVPLEQFSLGGQESIRGYRQDYLLSDNGSLFSVEVRVPILRVPGIRGILQIVPFVDVGTGWNHDAVDPSPSTLVGAGLGLLWRQGEYLTIRLDYGIPLISTNQAKRSWQENGIYFSVVLTPF
jgi:hemolysin activation/secretion protein